MGRVRTKTVKKSSCQVIERYCSRMTLDFHTNKKILEEDSKRTSSWYFIEASTRRRERVMDFVPEESAIRTDLIEVDKDTIDIKVLL
ncbi:hypothetical protein MKW92_031928 [Papaver armeniacum]|nr:hypothetical protein MKW92_031928 [Papaver armeniacum]